MSQRIIPTPEPITIGGQALIMSALTDRQFAELDRWVQSQVIATAAASVPADSELWDRIVSLAMREAITVTWANSRASRTKPGYIRLIWASCAAKTADLTEDRVAELLADASEAETKLFNAQFIRLNYPVKREAAKSESDPQTPPQ